MAKNMEVSKFEAYFIYTLLSLGIFIGSGIVYKGYILGIKEVCYGICIEPFALITLSSLWIIGLMIINDRLEDKIVCNKMESSNTKAKKDIVLKFKPKSGKPIRINATKITKRPERIKFGRVKKK